LRRVPLVFLALIAASSCRSSSTSDAAIDLPSAEWLDGRLPPETGTPRAGGTLVVRSMLEPATLNYLDSRADATAFRILARSVLDTLIELQPDGSLAPGLAASWTESPDHLTTRLVLRSATFSDGTPFTSKDVVATFAGLMDPARPTGNLRGEFSALAAWKAIDEHTVELTWSHASVFSIRALTRLPMMSAAQLAGDWTKIEVPLGTGPFVVKSWEHGQRLTLARRPDAKNAWLDTIVFRFVKDHTAAGAVFEKGEFDLMTNITPALWRALEQPGAKNAWARSGYHRVRSTDNSFSYIAWNGARAPFDDVRVREALGLLYDSKLITKVVDLELELPTSCPYWPGSESCSPNVPPNRFDPAAARALLDDAGWVDADGDGVRERDGGVLRFSFLLPANSVRLGRVVPMFQEQLRSVGADLEIERVETATLSARVNRREFDVVSRLWTEFDRDQDLFQLFHSSQIDGGANSVSLRDAQVDALLEQIRGEFDVAKRRALERHLHERLNALHPMLLMTDRQSLDAAKKRVHGLVPSVAWYDLRKVWVQD
jgi:peptide/nickel transport system substrate-binding protein